MAIAFVASATTTSSPASTMVVTLPTHSEGDVIVLAFVNNYNSAVQQLTSVDNGYTELAEVSETGLGHQASVFYKKAGASESNPTATFNNNTQIMACLAYSFSGVDATTQIDVGPSTWVTEDPGNADIDSPSVTTATDGAMLVTVASADAAANFTEPSGTTLVTNLQHTSIVIASAYEIIATAGATGVRTWTFAAGTDELTAVTFALKPAAGGPTTTPKTLTYTATGTAALTATPIYVVAPSASGTGSSTLSKLIQKTLSIAGIGTSSVEKKISKELSTAATGTANLDEAYITDISVSSIATGTLSLITKFIAAGTGAIVGIAKRIALIIGIGL